MSAGISLGTLASVVGIAGGVNSLMNSGSSGGGGASGGYGSGVPYYIPTGQSQADTAWKDALTQQSGATQGLSGQIDPTLLMALQRQLGMNYNPLAQGGAQAGQFAGQGAQGMMGIGGAEQMAGQQLFNAGLDPQNALYNRTLSNVEQQTNAQQALRGLGNSPVGAAEMGQTIGNFNIDWQNQQLQRMLQGAQGMGQANQVAGQAYSQAPGMAYQAGQYPIQGQQAAFQAPAQAATQYAQQLGQGMAPLQSVQSQVIPYLNYGQGQANNAYGAFSGQQQFGANQQQGAMSGITQGLGQLANSGAGSWLGSIFGGGGGSQTGVFNPGGYGIGGQEG